MSKLKILTVVGTRPEIIRLARVINTLEEWAEHVLVHTGQNYDYELNQVFFQDLGLREPDHFLECDTSSVGSVYGGVLQGIERVLIAEKPDAMVVLGDTNSCVSALMARRLKVPVYHLEAGNRSFDPNVPEEINRKMIDHVSDYNLVYTRHSRQNLLAEGLPAQRIILMGSPMREVLDCYRPQIETSDVLARLNLKSGEYLLASIHREENVDLPDRLEQVLESLLAVVRYCGLPLLLSTHPRTRARLEQHQLEVDDRILLHPPLGFLDYNKLQINARCVISDSGTIAEESTILGFPAVTIRDAIERPEAIDTGGIISTGLRSADVVDAVRIVIEKAKSGFDRATVPEDYQVTNSSWRVFNAIRATATTHNARSALRI